MFLNNDETMPSIFITHGGGPCFFVEGEFRTIWKGLENWLKNFHSSLKKQPKAIVIFSAHWEEDVFTVHIGERPPLLYDYYGFPEETYKIKYSAVGFPKLANQIVDLLKENNIKVKTEVTRGWDHGVFVPLKVMYPKEEIPIIQISLKNNLNVQEHIRIGQILQPLREQGVLIIGSGSSYHNFNNFGLAGYKMSQVFDTWLSDTLEIETKFIREKKLNEWYKESSARFSHPREEHLIPLMVFEGSSKENEKIIKVFSDEVANVKISCFKTI